MIRSIRLTRYQNGTFEDEYALINDNNEILLRGDEYHDNIRTLIDGFILGLNYNHINVNLVEATIFPTDNIFNDIGFTDNWGGEDLREEKD